MPAKPRRLGDGRAVVPDHYTPVPELQRALRELHLPGMSATLGERARQVARGQLNFLDALSLLVRDELEHRHRRALERRLSDSDLQGSKTLEGFDWTYNPRIPRKEILDLAALDFIADREAVLFVGTPGVGKSHCANALALVARQRGYRVLYSKAEKLIAEIDDARNRGEFGRFWSKINSAELLVIDDLFRREPEDNTSEYLALLLMRRCERLATLISSSRPLTDWPQLLGPVAVPVIERLTRSARLLEFTGSPWSVPKSA